MGPTIEQRAWVERVLGILPGAGSTGRRRAAVEQDLDDEPSPPIGMAGWTAARSAVIASLQAAERIVRDFAHEAADAAVIELRAIRANLTAEPTTPQQRAELKAYLEEDEIVADAEGDNGLGISLSVRMPLLAALAAFDAADTAGAKHE